MKVMKLLIMYDSENMPRQETEWWDAKEAHVFLNAARFIAKDPQVIALRATCLQGGGTWMWMR